MGQITKIAFELKNITQQALNNMDSDDDEEDISEDVVKKRQEITQWFRFCKEKIDRIQKVWEKKLGVANNSPPLSPSSSEDNNQEKTPAVTEEDNKVIDQLFENFNKRTSKSETTKSNADEQLKEDVINALNNNASKSEDMEEKSEFSDNQYWAVDNQYDIDDLMAEQDKYDIPDFHPNPWGGKDGDEE